MPTVMPHASTAAHIRACRQHLPLRCFNVLLCFSPLGAQAALESLEEEDAGHESPGVTLEQIQQVSPRNESNIDSVCCMQ
jgi:hypothetical protein